MTPTTVLVIDDEAPIRLLCRVNLEAEGIDVLEAPDGPSGLEVARAHVPDAILLDVMMPGLDGPSTVAALRADPATRDVPVIFLTAKMPSEDLEEWRPLRLAGVIPKPFDPMTLASDMAALLGWAAEAPA